MKKLKFLLLLSTLISFPSFAIDDTLNKVEQAKLIWQPIFDSMDSKSLPQGFTPEKFDQVNKMFYQAVAEFLNKDMLTTQQQIFETAIGRAIGENQFRQMMGLPTKALSYDVFSPEEKIEWDNFANKYQTEFKALTQKMKGFIPFLQTWIKKKKAARSS